MTETMNYDVTEVEEFDTELAETADEEKGGNGAIIAAGIGLVVAGVVAAKKFGPKLKSKVDDFKSKRKAKKAKNDADEVTDDYIDLDIDDDNK